METEVKSVDLEREQLEIVDGGHKTISCSNCRKELLDVWLTRPDASMQTKLVAKCPFCGDKSFAINIIGLYHIGTPDGVVLLDTDISYNPVDKKMVATILLNRENV